LGVAWISDSGTFTSNATELTQLAGLPRKSNRLADRVQLVLGPVGRATRSKGELRLRKRYFCTEAYSRYCASLMAGIIWLAA
jgi:hypothetical protein